MHVCLSLIIILILRCSGTWTTHACNGCRGWGSKACQCKGWGCIDLFSNFKKSDCLQYHLHIYLLNTDAEIEHWSPLGWIRLIHFHAKVVAAEGEHRASRSLHLAANNINCRPAALQVAIIICWQVHIYFCTYIYYFS